MSTDAIAEFEVTAVWNTTHLVEVPADQLDELRSAVARGELPDIVAEQLDSSTAELVDWDC